MRALAEGVVLASFQPSIARSSCSNWLVGAASMVQCPELCGLGAISFTKSFPSCVTKNSTASKPTISSASTRFFVHFCARASRLADIFAGVRLSCKIPFLWKFSVAGKHSHSPLVLRAAMIENSESRLRCFSKIAILSSLCCLVIFMELLIASHACSACSGCEMSC